MATKAIKHYEEQGGIAALMQDFSTRPAGGWQQKAYDRGVERERERKALKRAESNHVRRAGILGANLNESLRISLPDPVASHLEQLNHQYRCELKAARMERLARSIARVLNRWIPRNGK